MEKKRCQWAKGPLYIAYHDEEWGRPCHDDPRLFAFLILEGMQAGLSWLTILNKREAMEKAFDGFDPEKLAEYGEEKIGELMGNPAIIRNRLKLRSLAVNARAYREVCREYGSLDAFLWQYVEGKPVQNGWESMDQVPASTPLSDQISKDMKKLGFQFVGTTIIYAYIQSIGMVNDHITSCWAHEECAKLG